MKNLTIIGILLLGISGLLFYLTTNLEVEEFTLSHFMGIMGGVGIGLIIGGIVGYVSKGSSIKAEQKRKELIEQYRAEFATPYQAAKKGMVDAVIEPKYTRNYISIALEACTTKRELRPQKKHGLIPL